MSRKWQFSKDWEEKVRNIVRDEFSKNEDWLRRIVRDEFQKVEDALGDTKRVENLMRLEKQWLRRLK